LFVVSTRVNLFAMCRNILSPTARFLREANNNLVWLERKLSLLRHDDPDYESEKQSIESAKRELREIMKVANSPVYSSLSSI
jgi:hypothetical protein